MAASMRTKERQVSERACLPRPTRAVLSGRSRNVEKGVQGAVSAALKPLATPSLAVPITHLAAGMSVPISQTLKKRFGVGDHAVDGGFLHSIDTMFQFLHIAIQQEWLSVAEVDEMISNHITGSPEQSKACYTLINNCLNHISEDSAAILKPVKSTLKSFGFQGGDGGGWEIVLGVGGSSDEIIDADATPNLVAREGGLCVLVHDVSFIPQKLRCDVIQFIYFCSSLSYHATTIDMLLDDTVKWMILGDVAELSQDEERELIESADDIEKLEKILKKHFGDECIEDLFVSIEDIAEYYLSYAQVKAISQELEPFCKKNVRAFQQRISKSAQTPQWLRLGTDALLKGCQWDVDMTKNVRVDGHIPYGFSKPFGFSLPIENRMFESLHEMLIYGEEDSSLSVELGTQTSKVLANLELGESLLLLVEDNLQKEFS
jgi:hypothetical protein